MANDKQIIFLELWQQINDGLYMYARALEKCREDAEDLVHDTILASYENFEKLRDYSNFKAYVFKVARSKHIQKYRRSWLFGVFDEKKASELISNDYKPDLPLDIEILYEALDKLPAKQKEAIVLFEISGFSINEIQEIQGGTLSGIKSRLKRGREKLTEIMVLDDKFYKAENPKRVNTNPLRGIL